MLEFREITLADRDWMNELFARSDFQSEEYSFTFNYIWRDAFGYRVARMGDYLLIKSVRENRPSSYLYPAGSGDVVPVLHALREDAEADGNSLVFYTVLAEQVKVLETLCPGEFEFLPMRDYYDYIYDAKSLITLAGKKLHAKRNHINRFKENYPDWTYEPITQENLPEVVRMSIEWCLLNGCKKDRTLLMESKSVQSATENFCALGMQGGLLRAGGDVIAFSMGDKLNSNTFLVHIEKAYGDIQGAYAMINQQFAEHNCADFLYINREDDSGSEGLRKAKQSYRPVYLVEKFAAKWSHGLV